MISQIISINLHAANIGISPYRTAFLISEIRSYRENPISMIIRIKRRYRKYGYYQSGIAKRLLLIDLSGTYGIILKIKKILIFKVVCAVRPSCFILGPNRDFHLITNVM